jgi:cell division transport system permease protein
MIMQEKYKPVVKEIKESASKDKAIERITELVSILNRIGITVSFLFVIVAVASVYNTIRLTIYTRRQEVDIMKLVGASYSTIRRPFVREGIFYGILGAVITLFLIFPLSSFAAPGLLSYLNTSPSETLLFLMRSIPTLVLIEFIAGIGMGTISSLMATYAYLGSNKA